MAKISVITCTAKAAPNLERMAECLRSQTYTDFEWLIVDRLLPKRGEDYYKGLQDLSMFDINIVAPKKSIYHDFNLPDISNARNTGIIYSAGDILVWYDDNMWIPANYLEKHINMHAIIGSESYCVGLFWPFSNWDNVLDFSKQEPYDKYGNFCREGSFNDNNPDTTHGIRPDDNRAYMEFPQDLSMRQYSPYETVKGSWCYNGNLSFTLSLALKLNGYDEHLDGTFGGEDVNFGVRADNAGATGILDRSCCAYDYRGVENDSISDIMPFNWYHIGEMNGTKLTRREFDMVSIQHTPSRYRENAYFCLKDFRDTCKKGENI